MSYLLYITFLICTSLNAFSQIDEELSLVEPLEQAFESGTHYHAPIPVNPEPSFYLGYGGFTRYINTPDYVNNDELSFERADESSGYVLMENNGWDIGVGLAGKTLVNVGFGAMVGKTYFSKRHLSYKDEKREKLSLPTNKSSFNQWRLGDKMAFGTKTTFVLNLPYGFGGIFSIGPEARIQGQFLVTATKLNNDVLQIIISTKKLKSLNIGLSAVAIGTNTLGIKNRIKYLTFRFKFQEGNSIYNEELYSSIKEIFKGDLREAQKYEESSFGNGIVKSRGLEGYLGIPFTLSIVAIRNREISITNHTYVTQNRNEKVYISSHTRGVKTSNDYSKHKTQMFNFNNVVSIKNLIDGGDKQIVIAANIQWLFERDEVSRKIIINHLAMLYRRTGLERLKLITVPEGKSGYTKMQFQISASMNNLYLFFKDQNLSRLKQGGINLLVADYTNGEITCPILKAEKCFTKYVNQLERTINKLNKLKRKALDAFNLDNKKGFSVLMTKIMIKLFSNQRVIKAFIKTSPNLKVYLEIMGEDFKHKNIKLN